MLWFCRRLLICCKAKLFYPDSRINARAHFFSVRVILIWNRPPAALVQENNLSVFVYASNF